MRSTVRLAVSGPLANSTSPRCRGTFSKGSLWRRQPSKESNANAIGTPRKCVSGIIPCQRPKPAWGAGNPARRRLSAGSGRLKRRLRPRLAALQDGFIIFGGQGYEDRIRRDPPHKQINPTLRPRSLQLLENQPLDGFDGIQAMRVDLSRRELDLEPALDETDQSDHADGIDQTTGDERRSVLYSDTASARQEVLDNIRADFRSDVHGLVPPPSSPGPHSRSCHGFPGVWHPRRQRGRGACKTEAPWRSKT